MSKDILQFIDSIVRGESRKIKGILSSFVSKKTIKALDEKKKDVATQMFTPKKKVD